MIEKTCEPVYTSITALYTDLVEGRLPRKNLALMCDNDELTIYHTLTSKIFYLGCRDMGFWLLARILAIEYRQP